MIIVRLSGGLGNQMFQYAFGKALSLKNSCKIVLDISSYNKKNKLNTQRFYQLEHFPKINDIIIKNSIISKIVYLFYKIFQKKIVEDDFYKYNEINAKIKNGYFIGFWQNHNYFSKYKKEISLDFDFDHGAKLKTQPLSEKIINSNSVSIHIRRGDYIHNDQAKNYHGNIQIGYYTNAIKSIADKIKDPVYYIFSDDIDWVKNNLNIESSYYVSNKGYSDIEEMYLMTICKHNIIANSTFSWWGAYLNKNPDKIVIAPKKWLNNDNYNTSGVIPDNWIKI
jgi:hypothetical protein